MDGYFPLHPIEPAEPFELLKTHSLILGHFRHHYFGVGFLKFQHAGLLSYAVFPGLLLHDLGVIGAVDAVVYLLHHFMLTFEFMGKHLTLGFDFGPALPENGDLLVLFLCVAIFLVYLVGLLKQIGSLVFYNIFYYLGLVPSLQADLDEFTGFLQPVPIARMLLLEILSVDLVDLLDVEHLLPVDLALQLLELLHYVDGLAAGFHLHWHAL